MAKHRNRRTRRTRKIQKGGDWFNPGSWFGSSDPNAQNRTWSQWLKDTTANSENALTNAANTISSGATGALNSANQMLSTDVNITGSQQQYPTQQQQMYPTQQQQPYSNPEQTVIGGKRRRRSRRMRGGLGLTYYATPVSGIKVVEPDSWQYYANGTNQYSVKGGSRRTKRNRRTRRKSKIWKRSWAPAYCPSNACKGGKV
jgi:hypothetical protein